MRVKRTASVLLCLLWASHALGQEEARSTKDSPEPTRRGGSPEPSAMGVGPRRIEGDDAPRHEPIEDEGGRLFNAFGWAMAATAGADLASTEWGLTRPHLAEMNPLMTNRGVRVGVHVATPVAVWWVTDRMRRDGHPKLALVVRIGVTAVYGYATAHNLRALTRPPR